MFGEAQGRVVVTIDREFEDELIDSMQNSNVPFILLGHVTKGKMVIDDEHFCFVNEAKEIYDNSIEQKLT